MNDWSDEEADNRCSRTTAISTRSDVAQIAHEAFGDWGDAVAAALLEISASLTVCGPDSGRSTEQCT